MEPSEKLLYTRAEAAKMLSLSVATLDVAVARGMLRARRAGRRVLIEKRELEKFSRADHPHIWAPDGSRGSSVAGRVCFDCGKRGASTPAVRFLKRLPLCQGCFDERKSSSGEPGGATASTPTAAGSIPATRSNSLAAASEGK